ncbi:MAG: family 10 glycosylhydrolase [Acidobacteria bacterium]|nr:family 10 glycosylhydrolase [Acidobacteriota bacterium]
MKTATAKSSRGRGARGACLLRTHRRARGLVPTALLLLALLTPHAAAGQGTNGPATVPATPPAKEVRALWVVRTTLTSPGKIRTMVASAAAAGFNTLIVQVRGRGDAYYKPGREPRSAALKDQPADFDPLALTLDEAKRAGLSVHAWINTSLLANLDDLPSDPAHVYNAHPEWLAVPRAVAAELYHVPPRDPRYRARIVEWSKANRGELEGVYTSPAHPKVRDHVHAIWMDILRRYPALDGLHFDYVRLPSPDFDYGRASLEAFRRRLTPRLSRDERARLKLNLKTNPLAAAENYPGPFADFQREQLTALVARIYRAVKRRRPAAVVSAAVFADAANARARRFQDWPRWLSLGILDVACPMAYTTDTEIFRRQIESAAAAARASGRKIWAGVGAYRVPAESAVEKINAARAHGADGVILFSYDFTAAPSQPNNPAGDYLQRVRRLAFEPRPGN